MHAWKTNLFCSQAFRQHLRTLRLYRHKKLFFAGNSIMKHHPLLLLCQYSLCIIIAFHCFSIPVFAAQNEIRQLSMWQTTEWSITNNSWSGNPFDLVAEVKFTNSENGKVRNTKMFYAGNPRLETFEVLEKIIRRTHARRMHVHIWMWADASRKATPKQFRRSAPHFLRPLKQFTHRHPLWQNAHTRTEEI